MTDSAISAAVIPSHDAASEDDHSYDDLETVEDVRRDQGSASLSRSIANSHADHVRFPGFSSTRYHQQDSTGHLTPRTPLNTATRWLKTRWLKRSRSVDSLEHSPDLGSDVHGDRFPTTPHSEVLRMNQPPTREQQREARSHRAEARSRGRDREIEYRQHTTHFTDGIPDLRGGDSTIREESLRSEDPHHQPQGTLTTPSYDWFPGHELSNIQQLLAPLVPQPSSGPPHASTHSQGDDTMTTHSVTQTRQSLETRTPTTRSQNLVDPTGGLDVLFGDTAQSPPARETIPQHRIEETNPSGPHKTTTTREDQTPHSIPGEGSQNTRTHTTQGAYKTPRHPTDVGLTPVGDEMLQQASIRDRNRQHQGFWYTPGDGWDHTNLDLVGNRVAQDQRVVQRPDEMTRYRPTQQTEDWNSRMATIANVNPTLWSSDETIMVRNALDTMLRGGLGRYNVGRDVRTWFQFHEQEDSSASSSNTGYRDHNRSQSHSRGGQPTSPPRKGLGNAHGREHDREQGQHSQNLQTPHLQHLQDQSTTGGPRLTKGAYTSNPNTKQHQKNQQTSEQEHSTFRPSNTSQGRESGRTKADHGDKQTAGDHSL